MAQNLAKNGYEVMAYDINQSNLEKLKGDKMSIASSLDEIA